MRNTNAFSRSSWSTARPSDASSRIAFCNCWSLLFCLLSHKFGGVQQFIWWHLEVSSLKPSWKSSSQRWLVIWAYTVSLVSQLSSRRQDKFTSRMVSTYKTALVEPSRLAQNLLWKKGDRQQSYFCWCIVFSNVHRRVKVTTAYLNVWVYFAGDLVK